MNTMAALPISNAKLLLAAFLILINIVISAWLRLALGRSLILAAMRMVVQLLLVGGILEWLFKQHNPFIILLMAMLMASIAALAAVRSTKRRFVGIYLNSLLSVMASSALVTTIAIAGIIQPRPWFTPQYLIPLLGMVLGNTLNGVSLALDQLMEGLESQKDQVESHLSLGASRWEACQDVVQNSVRLGMIPTINSMLVMGLVSLPGMMTGQIMQGASPATAVRYQIVVIFIIAAATALGIVGVVLLGYGRLTSPDHQLRLDRLSKT